MGPTIASTYIDSTSSFANKWHNGCSPFAKRVDYDGVICIILSDPMYKRGQVVTLHYDAFSGTEIDEEFCSLAAWAKAAEQEIEERIRMGWNEGIKDLLD